MVSGDIWQQSWSIEVVVDIITPVGEELYMLCILDERAKVLQVEAPLREGEKIFVNQMNRWSGKILILITVGVTNFKKITVSHQKTTTDKKE